MSFKNVAKEYYDLGFNIIPIKPRTKNQPAFAWGGYQDKRGDQYELEAWIRDFGDHNTAILTGNTSKIIVVDIDGEEGILSLKDKKIPDTWVVKTARGYHYYFKSIDKKIGNFVAILPKVDIRGDGGYVVAPDSIHESGFQYQWHKRDCEIAELPQFFIDLIFKKEESPQESKKDETWLDKIKNGVDAGKRNDACTKLVGYYVGQKYKKDDIIDLILNWNRKNRPPLDENELKTVIISIINKDNIKDELQFRRVKPINIFEAKKIISKYLFYEDDNVVDLALAVIATTRCESDPLWLIIIGAASVGKTELTRSFDLHRDTYFVDSLTPAAIASGLPKAKGLLERLNNCKKTLVIQDFSTILSRPPYDRNAIIDSLRQMYNGKYKNEWGNGKKVTWNGKMNLLSCSTPAIEGNTEISELGERFLYYRIDSGNQNTRKQMSRISSEMCGNENKSREEIADALHGVLKFVENIDVNKIIISKDIMEKIIPLVDLTTTLRSHVQRNPYKNEIVEYEPQVEGPGRMMKAIILLIRGLAVVRGRTECNFDDLGVVIKVCLNSIPSIRRKVLFALIKYKDRGMVRAKDIADLCGYLNSTHVGYKLDDLNAIGICDSMLDGTSQGVYPSMNTPRLYQVKNEIVENMEQCGLSHVI
jgi:hypothetical protein